MALLAGDQVRATSGGAGNTNWTSGYFSVNNTFTVTTEMFIDAIETLRTFNTGGFAGTLGIAAMPFNNTTVIPWMIGLRGKQVRGDHTLDEWNAANPYMRVQLQDTAHLKPGVQYAFVQIGSAAAMNVPTGGNINSGASGMSISQFAYSFNNPPNFEQVGNSVGACIRLIESVNARPGTSTPTPGAYGTRAYGNGAPVVIRGEVPMETKVVAGATASMGAPRIARITGDITVMPSAPQPGDITLVPAEGPDTLASGPAGQATMSIDTWQSHSVSMRPEGKSNNAINLGQRFAIFSPVTARGGARDQFGAAGFWYLGSSTRMEALSVGKSRNPGWSLTTQDFPTAIYVYPSTPTPFDVLLAPDTGPGELSSMVSTAVGKATVKFSQTSTHFMRTDIPGRGGARDQFGTAGRWYLGSPLPVSLISRGKADFIEPYMGAPWHVAATSNGRAGSPYFYLGSPFRILMTSRGIAGCNSNRISGRVDLHLQCHARSGTRDRFGNNGFWYLGSSTRMAAVSRGVAAVPVHTLTSRTLHSTTYAKGYMEAYLGSAWQIRMTSRGKGGGLLYIGSRVYMAGTSPGRGGGSFYMGTPVRDFRLTSRGQGGGPGWYLSGTLLMNNITMRGVARWSLGPALMYAHVMQGVGEMADVHLSGTQRHHATSNGVGHFRDRTVLLRCQPMAGSADGTEFDKPPFAFVVYAGAKGQYHSRYSQHDPYWNHWRGGGEETGVVIYLSSRNGFANDHPTQHHRGPFSAGAGPSTMAGRSTFTFPYEMIAISNAGCRAYDGYRADSNFVAPDRKNWPRVGTRPHNNGYTGPEGVRFHQFSPDYMYARTDSALHWHGQRIAHSAGAIVYAYLSSRVYQGFTSRGVSLMTHKRVDEFDVFAKGGGIWTLGVDNRLLEAQSDGKGGWPINYLPDIRFLGMTTRGVAKAWAYQQGPVYFGPGLITSNGIGTMELSPTLFETVMRGVGHMFPIERPSEVYMQWGLGPFYWVDPDNFPRADPLLIPKSSSGISHVEIEIDTVPIMRQQIDGVGRMGGKGLEGIQKSLTWSAMRSGSYPFTIIERPQPQTGTPVRVVTGKPFPFRADLGWVYSPGGMLLEETPVEVVWNPNGIGHLRAHMRMDYLLLWQNWEGRGSFERGSRPYTSNDRIYTEDRTFVDGSGRTGAVGRMLLIGDRRFTSRSAGRANVGIKKDVSGRFANNIVIRGISAMLRWDLGGGEPPLDRYGNMLRYFFIPIPTFGQIWPRKERQHGQPVG